MGHEMLMYVLALVVLGIVASVGFLLAGWLGAVGALAIWLMWGALKRARRQRDDQALRAWNAEVELERERLS